MKTLTKLVGTISTVLLLCNLIACGTPNTPSSSPELALPDSSEIQEELSSEVTSNVVDSSDTTDSSTPQTGNVFLDAEVKTASVMNGSKNKKIGKRAYIQVNKEDALNASMDGFVEFANERVDDSGYNWWTVFFEDETGLVFTGSMTYAVQYGSLDAEGAMIEAFGMLMPEEDGSYTYQTFDE